jgi:hypothetical protein
VVGSLSFWHPSIQPWHDVRESLRQRITSSQPISYSRAMGPRGCPPGKRSNIFESCLLSPPPFCSTPVWQLDSGHGFHLKQSPHHHEHCRRYQQAATRQFWSYVAMVCQRAVVTKLVRCQWNLQRLRTRDDAETLAPWNSGCLFSSCVNSAILIALVSLMHGLPLLTEECGCTFAIPDLVQLPQGLAPIVSSSRRT